MAFPDLQGPQHRTTLVKNDNSKWCLLELNEPLSMLVQLDAPFHELEGQRSIITIVTTGEKHPDLMGFHFEEDAPGNENAERFDDEPDGALLAPEDDIQGIDIEVDAQQQGGVQGQDIAEGRVVVEPQKEDSTLVSGEMLTINSALANLRAACATWHFEFREQSKMFQTFDGASIEASNANCDECLKGRSQC